MYRKIAEKIVASIEWCAQTVWAIIFGGGYIGNCARFMLLALVIAYIVPVENLSEFAEDFLKGILK